MKQPVFHGSSIALAWLNWIYLVDFYGYFLEQWIGDETSLPRMLQEAIVFHF